MPRNSVLPKDARQAASVLWRAAGGDAARIGDAADAALVLSFVDQVRASVSRGVIDGQPVETARRLALNLHMPGIRSGHSGTIAMEVRAHVMSLTTLALLNDRAAEALHRRTANIPRPMGSKKARRPHFWLKWRKCLRRYLST